MEHLSRIRAAVVVALILCLPGSAYAAKRALIVAEEEYLDTAADLPPLVGVRAEAKKLATSLSDLGFSIAHNGPYEDIDRTSLKTAINEFVRSVTPGDTVIFSYSGHGMQANGVNYLLPIGADPDPNQPLSAIDLDADVLVPLGKTRASAAIVLIDACRNLPFLPTRGLTQPSASPPDTYIVFSTGPSTTSANPSPFVQALINHINEPGERIETVAAEVTKDVITGTSGAQKPQVYSTLRSEIVLRPASQVTLHSANIDDGLVVTIDGAQVASWSIEHGGGEQVVGLRKGPHSVIVQVYNAQTWTGGIPGLGGHLPEGWSYSLEVAAEGKTLTHLGDKEDLPDAKGSRHGKTFTVATFKLNVDPHTGAVSISDVADRVWKQQ